MKRWIITISILILIIPLTNAAGIGIAPSTIEFIDVLRGSTYEKEFKIDNTADEDINAMISIDEYEDWITLVPGNSVPVSARDSSMVKMMVDVPRDAREGVYETDMHVEGKPVETREGVGLIPGAGFKAVIRVTDEKIIEGYVDNIRTRDGNLEEKPKFLITLLNKGNVEVTPNVEILVGDDKMEEELDSLLPWKSDTYTIEYDKEVFRGLQTAIVKVYLGKKLVTEKEVSFSMLEGEFAPDETVEESKTNIVVGIMIIAVIVVVGLILYYVITKKKK